MAENKDAFEKWAFEGRKDAPLRDVCEIVSDTENGFIKMGGGWDRLDLLKAVESKFGSEELTLTGLAKIVKGESPTIALSEDQFRVIYALFGIHSVGAILHELVAKVGDKSLEKIVDARLKWISTHHDVGRIIISKGLADSLGVANDEAIKILSVEENLDELDLDR